MALIDLTYVSKANYQVDALILLPILKDSLRWNFDHDITGILFYDNGYFGQILKGPDEAVKKTFDKISRDPKHTVKRILEIREIKQRLFPNWSMKFFGADEILKVIPILQGALSSYDSDSIKILEAMRRISTENIRNSFSVTFLGVSNIRRIPAQNSLLL